MKKRILSHVLTLCLMLALMPTIALADDLTELYIGSNTAVTLPDNGKYTYGDNAGGAGIPANTLAEIPENATWYLYRNDSASPKYTLTLNGVSIPATANWTSSLDVNIFSSAMCARGDLSIVLVGENTFVGAGGVSVSYGICFESGSVTISGDGSLNMTGGNVTQNLNKSYGIYVAATIRIKGNANINSTGGNSPIGSSYGIYGSDVIIEENAQINAVAGTGGGYGTSCGIHGYEIVIEGNAQVDASASASGTSNGIYGYYINIKGNAQVDATGDTAGNSYGINASDGVEIEENAQVDANAGSGSTSIGIKGETYFYLLGGTTIARGDTYGVYSGYIYDSFMTFAGSKDRSADIDSLQAAAIDADEMLIRMGADGTGEPAKAVLITAPATYTYNTPTADTNNGVTATVTFDKNSPQPASVSVTATVNLTGTATAEGTHSINLTSTKANLSGPVQTATVTANQDLTTTPVTKTFIFTVPAEDVDDLTLTHTFKHATPEAYFVATDSDVGILSDVTTAMKYSVDGGTVWNDITDSSVSISGVSPANGVMVKQPGDGNTTIDSEVQIIAVTKQTAPTTVVKTDCTTADNNDGTLSGVTADMEWKKSDGTWATGDDSTITGITSGTYYVRMKAVGAALASDNLVLTIATYNPPAPHRSGGRSYKFYTIKASAGTGGSISNTDGTSLREGQNKTFTITPDEGYIILDVLVNGASIGPVSEYEFNKIQKNYNIEAIFAKGDKANFKLNGEYAGYPDVDESKWYGTQHEGSVRDATILGIIEGDGTGFRPEDGIKLSEVVKMAAVVWNTYYGSPYIFEKTEGTHWYDTYVNFVTRYGLIKEGDFADYERNATRAEMVYIFAHALPADEVNAISKIIPPDVSETDKYAEEILSLYAAGILCGNDKAGTFIGEREISRAETAAIINRIARPSARIAE